jgi:hypothetical protein
MLSDGGASLVADYLKKIHDSKQAQLPALKYRRPPAKSLFPNNQPKT